MDPATWIYLALLAASTAASAQGQHKTNKARAKVQAEDTRRRKEQQAQAEAASQKTQQAYFDSKGRQAAREQELAQLYAAKDAPAPTTDAAGTHLVDTAAPTQSTITVQGAQQEMAKGRARAAQRATSQAQIGAFGDVFAESGREAGRNAQDIGLAASKMQGWTQNVLPALYAKANVAGRDWATTGDILKLVSAVYAPYALGSGAAEGAGEVTAESIQAARFGDAAKLAQGFGAGGSIPFGSAAGLNAGNALISAGGAASAGSELVGGEGLSRALWKQLNGYDLSEAERRALLMRQMAGGY
jgi:hypothetical protein